MGKALKLGDIFNIDDENLIGDHFHYGDSRTETTNVPLPAGRYYVLTKTTEYFFVSNIEPLRGEFYLLGKSDIYRIKRPDLDSYLPISKVPASERREVVEFLKQIDEIVF